MTKTGAVEGANHHMYFTIYIGGIIRNYTNRAFMVSHATTPTATIDITYRTAPDIGIGTGFVVFGSEEIID